MLKYIERTVEDNVTNQDIDTIHQFVKKVKRKKEVGINYMKSWELEEIYRKEAREEGLAEGRAKGHAEGLEQGIAVLIKTCRSLSLSSEDICSRLVENFSLTTEKAEEYIRKYGK